MLRTLALLAALLPAAALGQVQQSGNVSPGHFACWTINGVIQDSGTGVSPFCNLLPLIMNGPGTPFIIDTAPPVSGAFNQYTEGATATDFILALNAVGGATHIPLQLSVNGFVGLTIADTGVFLGGNVGSSGAVPSVTSGGGACGNAPVIVGNNSAFRITVGSSTNGGNCPIAFSAAFTNPPICTPVNETSGARGAFPATPTANGVTITADSTFSAGDSIGVICQGYK